MDIENNDVVTINVGGKIFKTKRSTLKQSPYFIGKMNKKNVNIFVDRDPKLFRYILNYLRTNDLRQMRRYMLEMKDLANELKFYGLELANHPVDITMGPKKIHKFIPKHAHTIVSKKLKYIIIVYLFIKDNLLKKIIY